MKISLIGYGYWGPNVARHLNTIKRVDFASICDLRSDRLERARTLYAESIMYTTEYRTVLNNPEIEAVAIAVETSEHYKLAKEALLADKHVYIEKPFTSTVKQAEELRDLALQRNLLLHVDHIMVFHPCVQKIKELYDNGELGEILYIDASRANLGQIKNDVSAMWDLAVHDLSIIDYLTGERDPNHVHAVGKKQYSRTETLTFLTIQYPTFIAHILSNWISPLKERKIIVAGTKKMAVFDDMKVSEKLMVYDKGFDILPESNLEYVDFVVKTRTGDAWSPFVQESDALHSSISHFINCIEDNTPSITGPDSAIAVLKILEAADRCMVS